MDGGKAERGTGFPAEKAGLTNASNKALLKSLAGCALIHSSRSLFGIRHYVLFKVMEARAQGRLPRCRSGHAVFTRDQGDAQGNAAAGGSPLDPARD